MVDPHRAKKCDFDDLMRGIPYIEMISQRCFTVGFVSLLDSLMLISACCWIKDMRLHALSIMSRIERVFFLFYFIQCHALHWQTCGRS